MFNIVLSFGHFQTHRIFFVGTGLPTGVNETKSAAFCRNSRLKSKFDIRSYTYVTNTRKYIGLLCHDFGLGKLLQGATEPGKK